jgi:hypothetical protein
VRQDRHIDDDDTQGIFEGLFYIHADTQEILRILRRTTMGRKKRMSREERHAELMRTNDGYRRLAERVERRRSDEERAAYPLGSEAFSLKVTRDLRERIDR